MFKNTKEWEQQQAQRHKTLNKTNDQNHIKHENHNIEHKQSNICNEYTTIKPIPTIK